MHADGHRSWKRFIHLRLSAFIGGLFSSADKLTASRRDIAAAARANRCGNPGLLQLRKESSHSLFVGRIPGQTFHRIQRDEVDKTGESPQQAGELPRLENRGVDAVNKDVLEGHFSVGLGKVISGCLHNA